MEKRGKKKRNVGKKNLGKGKKKKNPNTSGIAKKCRLKSTI